MKRFNTAAVCIPSKHYMVDLSERVMEIRKLVDDGKFFTINRARQYGKTTTIEALCPVIAADYRVVSLDFQDIEEGSFQNGGEFSKAFARIILDAHEFDSLVLPLSICERFSELVKADSSRVKMDDLFRVFRYWFQEEERLIVLIIDEIDRAANNQVFLDFLAGLRSLYLKREKNDRIRTFQSVILAGVTDVKHLKSRIRPEEQHNLNSPWNIASDFDIDMSLSQSGIMKMLDEYEEDHKTGMNTESIAGYIWDYTSGYPFLVSRICQLIDEDISKSRGLTTSWTRQGVDEAIKMILSENNTLFRSLTKNLDYYPQLKDSLRSVLMEGTKLSYNAQQDSIVQLQMYGLIRNDQNTVRIANRIFETMLYDLFLSDEELNHSIFAREGELVKNLFVSGGKLNMRMILERFIATYTEICGPLKDHFKEKDGREYFLLYLKPIINGTGNYYIEAQTRNQTRTDVIIDYLGQQFIVELKIWRGERYNSEGERQICQYLDYWNLNTGYMLSFNFNQKKKQGVERVQIGDKVLFEGTV